MPRRSPVNRRTVEVGTAGFSAPTFDGALPPRQLCGRRGRDISDRTHTVPNRGTCRRRRLLTLPTEKRHCDVPHGDVRCHLLRLRLSDQVRDTVVSMTERENPPILPFEETSGRPRESRYRMAICQGPPTGAGECSHCHMWPTLEKKNGSRWTNHPFRGNYICTWLGEEPSVIRHVPIGLHTGRDCEIVGVQKRRQVCSLSSRSLVLLTRVQRVSVDVMSRFRDEISRLRLDPVPHASGRIRRPTGRVASPRCREPRPGVG